MWLFLSTRIRTWVLFSIAVPLAAKAVHAAAERARRADASSTTTTVLARADRTLNKVARRRSKHDQRSK